MNTRTLESAALIPAWSAVLLAYVLPREGRRESLRYLVAFLAGGALTGVAMLGYNVSITGDPFTAAYAHDGTGSVIGYTKGFTFDIGLRNEQTLLMAFILVFNGWPALVGIAFIFLPFILGTRNRWDYFCAACALSVTGVYVIYRWSGLFEGPRYWYQAVPFLILLTARGAEVAAQRMGDVAIWFRSRLLHDGRPAHWAGILIVYALVAVLVVDGTGGFIYGWNKAWLEPDVPAVPNELKYLRALHLADDTLLNLSKRQKLGNALVLVKPCGPLQSLACYDTVFVKNSVNFDSEIVWAIYLPGKNATTVDAFPGREVYVATAGEGASIVPYDPLHDQ